MKLSPLQLGPVVYTEVSVKAMPEIDRELLESSLPVTVDSQIFYDETGRHFSILTVRQSSEEFPYVIQVTAFATFTLDKEGCRAAYRGHFNPAVIGVNIARLLYSTTREMIVNVTERGPYDAAKIPTLILEPDDIQIAFSDENEEKILREQFDLTDDQLQALRDRHTELGAEKTGANRTDKSLARKRRTKP
jgi:hypothetical protein